MTQNKFWLVWNEAGNAPKKPHDTQEKAIIEAKRLASMYPQHAYIVLEATHSFKADVNIVETSFEATPEELKLIPKTEYRKKFSNGDLVKIKNSNDAFKIIACGGSFTKEYTGNVYDIESIKGGKIYRAINECDLMPEDCLAVEPKFKIGDIVNINAIGFKGSRFEITYSSKHKGIESYYYSVKDIKNQNERSHGINEMYVTLAE